MRVAVNLLVTFVLFLALGLFPGGRSEAASPPVITQQPTNVTLLGGGGTTLRVSAEGDPTPEYQWYFEQAPLAGQTFSILGVFNASTLKQGSYFAIVSNAVGSVTSDVAVVTVVTNAPSILSQPSNISLTVGQSATISITATGLPPPSYTWWFNENNRLNSTSPQLALTAAHETNSGIYTVVLSNSVAAITSAPIAVTVSPVPVLTLQPTNQTLIETDVLIIHVAAIGPPTLSYQWFLENDPIAGATATNFIIASVRLTNSGNYYCVVSNYGGTATSEVATVTVSPAPTHPGALDVFYKPNTDGWITRDLILLEADHVLAAGSFSGSGLLRLRFDGTLDTSFTSNAFSSLDDIALQPDGKIIAANANSIERLDSNGVRDLTFSVAFTDRPSQILAVDVQPDGGVIFSGQDSSEPYRPFGRLLTNGLPDPFFRGTIPYTGGGGVRDPNSEPVKFVTVLPDGRIMAPYPGFWRHHPDGTMDSSFQPNLGLESRSIESLIPTRDQRAFIAIGTFTNFAGAPRRYIARLDYGGQLDGTFIPSTNLLVLQNITAATVQNDGKVIVGGQLFSSTSNLVMRLNVDGSLDETFTPALLWGSVNVLGVQSDGRILLGGSFIRVSGRRIHGLARLHGDPPSPPGILEQPKDATVTVGQNVSFHATVRAFGSVSYQWFHNDQLIATAKAPLLHLSSVGPADAGDYRLVIASSHGAVTSQVARLTVGPNPETPGAIALESTFNVDGSVYEIASAPNGQQVIAGNFNHVDGVPRPGLARLNADGSLDTTFDPPETTPRHVFQYVRALAVTPDGNVYIGGAFTNVGGVQRYSIARLRDNGTLDGDFDPANALRIYPSQVNAIALQADGKVLAAGSFQSTSNLFWGGTVARFHTNGSVDTNFTHRLSGEATCLAVINTNAILVGGTLRASDGGLPIAGVYRLQANGFQEPGPLTGFLSAIGSGVRSLVALPNGKILVGGGFYVQTNLTGVARLMANGMLDPSFNPGVRAEPCSWVADGGCGKVLIGGTFRTVDGQPHRNLARLNTDGTVDATFDSQPFDGAVTTGVIAANGEAIVAGEFFTANGTTRLRVARIKNGPYEGPTIATQPLSHSIAEGWSTTLRTEIPCTFPPPTFQWQFNGINLTDETNLTLNIADTRLSRDGAYQLVVSNAVGVVTSWVAQLTVIRAPRVPGAPEIESTSIFSGNSVVRCLQVLPDGKVLVGGSFSNMFGHRHRGLFRLNPDASLDTTFAFAGTNEVRALALYPDGRIVINEWFTGSGPSLGNTRIFRLHPNGAIDTTFVGNYPPNPAYFWNETRTGLRSVAIDSANQIYVSRETGIIRLVDGWTKAIHGTVHNMAFQPDGKLLLAGAFGAVSGVFRTNLARLQTNGLLDQPFVPWAGFLQCMALQPDGKIVVGGPFTSSGGLVRRGVARFHGDGTLDEEFSADPGIAGTNATVNAVALQPDGKVIIGGSFATYDGVPCNNIARLHADGTLDPTFQPGTGIGGGTNPVVNAITFANDGHIFIGGRFNTFNGVPRNSLARAYNNPKVLNFSRDEPFTGFSFLSLLDRTYILETKSAVGDDPWLPVHSVLGDGTIKNITHSNGTPNSLFYRLRVE